MRRIKVGWLTFILTLMVLVAPMRARADYYWYYSGAMDGGTDPAGDPDQPMGPRMEPNTRIGIGGTQKHPSTPMNQVWMKRYLMLLSGLRSYYLRF